MWAQKCVSGVQAVFLVEKSLQAAILLGFRTLDNPVEWIMSPLL
jgi:hypothetical protein